MVLPFVPCRRFVAGCLLAATLLAARPLPATDADPATGAPQWLQAAGKAAPRQFQRPFVAPAPLRSARLRLAVDFCRARVLLNGREIAQVEPFSPLVELDVTPHLRAGDNQWELLTDEPCGPAAVAASLELDGGASPPASLVTDSTWQVRTGEGPWLPATARGPVRDELWGRGRRPAAIDALDNYEQWRQATTAATVSNPAQFWVASGFEITLLRAAQPDEGSWVSLAFDPRGRLTVAREDQGLLRMTLAEDGRSIAAVETINSDLLECRGLLYAHDALYASANNSKGLYRLRDTDGNETLDEVKLLREFPGGVGHGRNDLALGPDGLIYAIHGDSVEVPPADIVDRTSPFRAARRGQKTSEGFLLRTDRDGRQWELLCGGMRNPFGVAFNAAGDSFTYDADAEFDMGAPWYRPTRVLQLLSGADFGWRGVTGAWPPYDPDQPEFGPPSLDIGKGSPTAVAFAAGSRFPAPYHDALFILDWAYGRILAVHQVPRGGGYRSRAETFLKGRPLNVTDLAFGPDGALYLTTGGRKTQAALYRVDYVGPAASAAAASLSPHEQDCREHAAAARRLRRELEAFHGPPKAAALEAVWPHLAAADPVVRHAARIALECQPPAEWTARALSEPEPAAALEALLALARSGESAPADRIVQRLLQLDLATLGESQLRTLVRVYTLCLDQAPATESEHGPRIAAQLAGLFAPRERPFSQLGPAATGHRLQRELAALLVRLQSPGIAKQVADTLLVSDDQADRLHALLVLRNVKAGWTPDTRRAYFTALNEGGSFVGGDGMPRFLASLRDESLATLTPEQKAALADVLQPASITPPDLVLPSRPVVKAWKLDDLRPALADSTRLGDPARGAVVFRAALCVHCHRVGARGPAVGPDLTHVGGRFSRQDMLESVLTPSQVIAENYRNIQVLTTGGQVLVGRVLNEGDYRSEIVKLAVDPLRPSQTATVSKRDIERSQLSDVSPMPKGLLDSFTENEILDLLAYLQRGGP